MGFIKFILILIVAFYLLGLLGRLMLRLFLRRLERNARAGQNSGGYYYKQYTWGGGKPQQEPEPPEGEIKVTEVETQRKISKKVGDYIEYEEIKE